VNLQSKLEEEEKEKQKPSRVLIFTSLITGQKKNDCIQEHSAFGITLKNMWFLSFWSLEVSALYVRFRRQEQRYVKKWKKWRVKCSSRLSFVDEVDWITDEENEAVGMQWFIPAHACHINLPLENQFFWVEIRSLEDFAHPLLFKLPFTLLDILKWLVIIEVSWFYLNTNS
jgi:hypothetical protein